MAELPVWLRKSFVRAVQQAGSPLTAEELEAPFVALVERWSDPARRFHGVAHVAACLSRLDKLTAEIRHPAATTLAMWYHGVAFDTSPAVAYAGIGGENEERSAQIARVELAELGVPEQAANMVAMLILGMRYPVATMSKPGDFAVGIAPSPTEAAPHHRKDDDLSADSVDIIALRDAHLADLAAAPQAYKKYLTEIREEYPEIPEEKFLRARLHIVNRFLARKHLFATPGTKSWEDHARQNLAAEAGRIAARLEAYHDAKGADGSAKEAGPAETEGSVNAGDVSATAGSKTADDEVTADTTEGTPVESGEASEAASVSGTREPATAAGAAGAASNASDASDDRTAARKAVRRISIFEQATPPEPIHADTWETVPIREHESSREHVSTRETEPTGATATAERAGASDTTDALDSNIHLPRTDELPKQSETGNSAPAADTATTDTAITSTATPVADTSVPVTETSELPVISAADTDADAAKLSTLEWCVDQLVPNLDNHVKRPELPRTDRARREQVSTKTLEVIARRTREAQEARAQRQARETNANSPLADKQRATEAQHEERSATGE